ncbi:MAG: magnesium chelatase subunit D [Acetobacteraceae bacterium]|nr:magnesium chelatase subunit D [Acetobacteraceae bacterium]
MTGGAGAAPWDDATLAAALLAISPDRLKGLVLRARPGPVRDRFLALLRRLMPPSMTLRKLPPGVPDQRLLGGLDLAATLQAGRPVAERGLLAECHGGIVLVPMAERLAPGLAARLAAVLDRGEVVAERDGMAIREDAALGLVLLDEGAAEDEHAPAPLTERIALAARLEGVPLADAALPETTAEDIARARDALPSVTVPDQAIEALCGTAMAFGIASLRAPVLALEAARAAAALAGRTEVSEADAITAARLVLAPRATRMPTAPAEEEAEQEEQREDGGEPPPRSDDAGEESEQPDPQALADLVLAAAVAAVPPGLLASLATGASRGAASAGKAGAAKHSSLRGAPLGARPGMPGGGARLALLETLRAAAPWQALRRRDGGPRIAVRRDDFRIKRFRERSETTTIFAVDASGSSALARLAEAKGAVELLLADCYVRRDRVALIAFRGRGAELLLPPTTSLVRAKRSLAGLPGGGGTPIAAGLDAARVLAEAVLRRGGTPMLVVLTDGRANVARDGTGGREAAAADALAAARQLAALRVNAVLLDTSPRPQPQAAALAAAMGARYVPLPYADAASLSRAVKAAQAQPGPARAA